MPSLRESSETAGTRLTSVLVASAWAMLAATPAFAGEGRQWTQFTPGGLEARAIAEGTECPRISIDGREASMSPRADPEPDFPHRVCAAAIPSEARTASIAGRPLPLPAPRIDKILLVGDTGCRLKAFPPIYQDCNAPEAWPFRRIADAAARRKPDLVVHVGDLHYRETACPPGRAGCAGSPYGDNWETWKADFFSPAEPLLAAAPWAFVRGNHEECRRAGKGWSRLIDAYPFEAGACRADEAPYAVDLGGVTLVVMDVVSAEDRAVDEKGAAKFRAQFERLAALKGPLWLAFHKPIFATVRIVRGETAGDNKTLVAAARDALPANAQAIVSGHLHILETVSYAEDLPAQIVAGHGGDWIETLTPKNFDGLVINGVTVEQGRAAPAAFGFAMLERAAAGWLFTGYDSLGAPLLRCRLRGRKLDCG